MQSGPIREPEQVGLSSKRLEGAYGILRNPDDADDIAQEVFAKVYFSIKSFQARSSLYTWISRIAINDHRAVKVGGRRSLRFRAEWVDAWLEAASRV